MRHRRGAHLRTFVVPLAVALVGGCGQEKVQHAGPAVRVWDGGAITTPALTLQSADPEQGIVGSMALGGTDLSFSSRRDPVTGNTVARMSTQGGGGQQVVVSMSSSSSAKMTVGGQEISGDGVPTAAQQAALVEMGSSAMGPSLAMLPLEIGCMVEGTSTDRERAALLVPWQMLIKYQPAFPSSEVFERASSCRYFEPADQNQSLIDGGTPPPRGRGIRLANDDRVPNVFGIFPFDGVGAVEPTAQFGHDTRPCTALCFGTCGPDCDANACTTTYEWYCLKSSGNNTGWKRVRRHWNCGSHQGCRDHDACYDNCNQSNGCDTWGATMCRRACDTLCLNDHGVGNCTSWMNGGGPFDARRDYFHDIGVADEQDTTLCPAPNDAGAGGGGTDGTAGMTGAGGMSGGGGAGTDGGVSSGGMSGSGGAVGSGGSGGYPDAGVPATGGSANVPGTGGLSASGGLSGSGAFPGSGGAFGSGGFGGKGAFPGTGGTFGSGGFGGYGAFPGSGGTFGSGGFGGYGAFPGSGGTFGSGGFGGYAGFAGSGGSGVVRADAGIADAAVLD